MDSTRMTALTKGLSTMAIPLDLSVMCDLGFQDLMEKGKVIIRYAPKPSELDLSCLAADNVPIPDEFDPEVPAYKNLLQVMNIVEIMSDKPPFVVRKHFADFQTTYHTFRKWAQMQGILSERFGMLTCGALPHPIAIL